jgi:hypothetical protein
VVWQATYGGAVTKRVENSYDYANRWIKKTLDSDGNGTVDSTSVFAYDGNQIVLQFDAATGGNLTSHDLTHRYLWGPVVDQLLTDEQVHYDSGSNTFVTDHNYWTLTDNLNTVRDVAEVVTGNTVIVNHITYNSFGQVTAQTAGGITLLFGYTGKAQDQDTGLNQHQQRWYDPASTSGQAKTRLGLGGATPISAAMRAIIPNST